MVLAVPLTRRVTTLLAAVLGSLALTQADERGTLTQTQASSTGSITRADAFTDSITGSVTAIPSFASATASSSPSGSKPSSNPSLCEARTINYITHRLPQSCLTSSWVGSRSSLSETLAGHAAHPSAVNGTPQSEPERSSAQAASATPSDSEASEVQQADPAATTFMSFEDWKEMMLRRAGQDPQEWQSRRASEQQTDERYPPDMGHAGLGEEDEISLNFDNYGDGGDRGPTADTAGRKDGSDDKNKNLEDAQVYSGDKSASVHRSKDAGKTCKERFSYSSFDAGATILKTASGAKNARAILVENKDSYMLLECAAPSKYVIVELSDDILVDTIVLANFEFFSSMVRHFRVSVSDRYPVRTEKWLELSTFEARNSRDIQPFLIENPQIWAKYVRIEFLTHYGNEYYCPVSLLRIHGTRMLDSWKDSETAGRDEELQIEGDEAPANLVSGSVTPSPAETEVADEAQENTPQPVGMTPWVKEVNVIQFDALAASCPAAGSHTMRSSRTDQDAESSGDGGAARQDQASAEKPPGKATPTAKPTKSGSQDSKRSSAAPSTAAATSTVASPDDRQTVVSNTTSNSGARSAAANETPGERGHQNATAASATKPSSSGGVGSGKPRSSGTSSASAASPTVQEGFFNAITKRLQQVEANLTLSLQYVEDQSRHVQEALQRGEQKQHSKVTVFLSDLNQTVLAELRNIRDQYDQIWQSTVLALDSQSDRSERDMMALTTRLNLLADEVVFQKRMAIVQAVILLSCLFLVIFSHGVPIPSLAPFAEHAANASYAATASPPTPHQDRDLHRGQQHSPRSKRHLAAAHDALNYAQTLPCTEEKHLDTVSSAYDAALVPQFDDPQDALSHYQRMSHPQHRACPTNSGHQLQPHLDATVMDYQTAILCAARLACRISTLASHYRPSLNIPPRHRNNNPHAFYCGHRSVALNRSGWEHIRSGTES